MSQSLSEAFERKYQQSDNAQVILEELEAVLDAEGSLQEVTEGGRSRLTVKGMYVLYKLVCDRMGKQPSLAYNGVDVRDRSELEELESEAGKSFDEFFGEIGV